jgi:hypothetical protein
MSGKKNKMLDAGEVVLINKPTEPQSIAPTTLEKMKPKRELSEKQKENVAKLIERNKQRAMERRNVITNNIPEVIPEDKIAVVVKPKRKYVRKAPAWNARPPTAPESVPPTPEDTEEESDYYDPPPRPKKETKKKIVVKKAPKPKRYETETSATSDYDEDEESDSSEEDVKVEKYVRKAQKRIEAVQAIENRLKKMSNPYEARGLSIF